MRNVIQQSVVLPAAAETLWEIYLDPAVHGAFTGKPVTIAARAGAEFRAFDGMLTGTILAVVRPRLVVQSWRSALFKPENRDSTLLLSFTPEGEAGRIDLVHVDVPDHDYDDVVAGWEKYYWTPWRHYLASR